MSCPKQCGCPEGECFLEQLAGERPSGLVVWIVLAVAVVAVIVLIVAV